MPTIRIFMPSQIGATGLTLFLCKESDGALLNAGGDALTESPVSSGHFSATVAEAISEICAAVVTDAIGPVDGGGWLPSGGTLITDTYPYAGGGGGGGLTSGQAAQLDRVEAATGRIRGGALNWTGNVGDGGRLILTLGDDHETVVGNSLPIVVADPGQLLYTRLTASGTSLQWAAGQDAQPALIAGTVEGVTEADGFTTITVEVPDCAATGNTLAPYTWQLQRTLGGRRVRELKGTLTLEQDMIGA